MTTTERLTATTTAKLVRLDPATLRLMRIAAGSRGQSVQAWAAAALRAAIRDQAADGDSAVRAALRARGQS